MSVTASASSAPYGTLYAIANNATSNLMVIQDQGFSGATSVIKSPTSAWMFSSSNNQLILMLNQSPPSQPAILILQPQPAPVVPLSVVPYGVSNNATWAITDKSGVSPLVPENVALLSMASAINAEGASEGTAISEVYPTTGLPAQASFITVNLADLRNGVTSVVPLGNAAITTLKTTVPMRVVSLPGSAIVSAVVIGQCATASTSTCMTFFSNSTTYAVEQTNLAAYSLSNCLVATSNGNIIVMVSTTGISTFSYAGVPTGTNWKSVSNTAPQSAPLSCSISGTELFVVVEGDGRPNILTAPISGTGAWALKTQNLTTPILLPQPSPPPSGSTGDSGGAPGSGGNGNGGNSNAGSNGSQSGSTTGLGKPVIIAIAVVAAVILILIPALFIWWCRRKRQNGKQRDQRTEELKKSIVLEHGGGKRMGMSMPMPRVIPPVPPRHSPLTFLLETPGTTPALGGMTIVGNDRDSQSGSSSVPGSSTMSYDEKFSNHHSLQPSMHSLPHPYQQPSRTWSQDGGGNGGSPSPRTLNQQHQHSFSDNDSTAGPGSVDGYHTDSRMARGGIFDDKHEIVDDRDNGDMFAHHERSTTSMSYLKSPALTDLEPPMPLMSPMYSPPGVHYQTPSSDSSLTANSTLSGAPMVQNSTKPKRIRIEDMVSPGLINAQLILQQSQKPPQKPSNLR